MLENYNNSACIDTNWLYNNEIQWLLAPHSDDSIRVRIVRSTGDISHHGSSYSFGCRPVTFLTSHIKITSGDGTISNPYELSL